MSNRFLLLAACSRLMGSDAFRSLFTLYQSKTRVSSSVQSVTEAQASEDFLASSDELLTASAAVDLPGNAGQVRHASCAVGHKH